jgi:hypothetical protein
MEYLKSEIKRLALAPASKEDDNGGVHDPW